MGVVGNNSGYLTATAFTIDSHSTPVGLIVSMGGTIVAEQVSIFLDRRTGARDIPMRNSGYRVTRTVFRDATTGVWILTTTKEGANTTANGFASNAGAGGPITRTQAP